MTQITAPETRAAVLQKAHETVRQYLDIDREVVDLVLATVLANLAPGDPVWVFLVGPPSSGKSELIRGLRKCHSVYTISALTANTFASGWEDEKNGREPSLLMRVGEGQTLAVKDFGSIQALNPHVKADVVQQLREIYDGAYHKEYGTGKVVDWQGRLGLMAGVTPAIEKDHAALGELGERFVMCRVPTNDRKEATRRALQLQGQEEEMRSRISAIFSGVLAVEHAPQSIRTTAADIEVVVTVADVLARLRSPVARDRARIVIHTPEPEGPPRVAKVLLKIVRAVASLRGHTDIQPEDMALAKRVVKDSVPSVRVQVLNALLSVGPVVQAAATEEVRNAINLPLSTTRRTLEDLHMLGVVKKARGKPERWWVSEEQRTALAIAGFGPRGQDMPATVRDAE